MATAAQPTEDQMRVEFVQSGDAGTEDERMVDLLRWLLEIAGERRDQEAA
jgi:hypothetical protein